MQELYFLISIQYFDLNLLIPAEFTNSKRIQRILNDLGGEI